MENPDKAPADVLHLVNKIAWGVAFLGMFVVVVCFALVAVAGMAGWNVNRATMDSLTRIGSWIFFVGLVVAYLSELPKAVTSWVALKNRANTMQLAQAVFGLGFGAYFILNLYYRQ